MTQAGVWLRGHVFPLVLQRWGTFQWSSLLVSGKAEQREAKMRHHVLQVWSPWLPHLFPSIPEASSVSLQQQVSLHFFLCQCIWVEFLSPIIQRFLNIRYHSQSSCPKQVYRVTLKSFFHPKISSITKFSGFYLYNVFSVTPLFSEINSHLVHTIAS